MFDKLIEALNFEKRFLSDQEQKCIDATINHIKNKGLKDIDAFFDKHIEICHQYEISSMGYVIARSCVWEHEDKE